MEQKLMKLEQKTFRPFFPHCMTLISFRAYRHDLGQFSQYIEQRATSRAPAGAARLSGSYQLFKSQNHFDVVIIGFNIRGNLESRFHFL